VLLAAFVIGTALLNWPKDAYSWSPSPASNQDAPHFQATSCPFPLGADQVEGQTVTCGFVTVPEVRGGQAGQTIRLAVAVFKARGAANSPPLIFLGGGPGSAILSSFGPVITGSLAEDLTAGHDLILFDQRGVGFSQPSLACQEMTDLKYQNLGLHITREEETDGTVEAALRCRDRLRQAGVNLAAYTTAASAADVDDIRRALGYATVDLWGLSYGTRLALTVMETYPEMVHAAVLDSTMPTQIRLLVERSGTVDHAFRALFDGCAADSACAAAYPNLEDTFYQLVAELNVTPLSYQAQDPRTGIIHTIVLTGDGLVNTLFDALHFTDMIPLLPLVGASLRAGDTTLLALAAGRLIFDDSFSQGMNYSVQCAEEANITSPKQVARAGRRVRSEIADVFTFESVFRVCSEWGAARISPSIKTPVVSAIPTLILAGQYDPATPPEFGRIASRTLRNSFFFEFPGVGHYVGGGSPCAHDIMLQFLNDPKQRPDAACIDQMGPPAWIIPPAP
jgi:pimeloyl-ACP methyl ester carboxylesterase